MTYQSVEAILVIAFACGILLIVGAWLGAEQEEQARTLRLVETVKSRLSQLGVRIIEPDETPSVEPTGSAKGSPPK